jgi:hypothetical protein
MQPELTKPSVELSGAVEIFALELHPSFRDGQASRSAEARIPTRPGKRLVIEQISAHGFFPRGQAVSGLSLNVHMSPFFLAVDDTSGTSSNNQDRFYFHLPLMHTAPPGNGASELWYLSPTPTNIYLSPNSDNEVIIAATIERSSAAGDAFCRVNIFGRCERSRDHR